jgi:general secretion pathway protein F
MQEAGQLPLAAQPVESAGFGQRAAALLGLLRRRGASRRERAAFIGELASLLHAGLPLDRALQIILDASGEGEVCRLASAIQLAVRGGASLSQALEAQPEAFSRFHVAMVRAAEASGALAGGLARLAEHEERSRALREAVLSALIYPAVLVLVTGAALLVILAFVVPQFSALFADAGRALPLSTQIVLAVAEALRSYGWLLAVAIVGLALYVRRQLASRAGRYRIDSLLLRLPLGGSLVRRVQMARFARTLGSLLASGVPLLAAIGIVRETLSNQVLADALELAAEALKAGRSLADPLLSTGLFPALGMQMLKVGEETGQLDQMLTRVAELYDREVAAATQRLLALLEPVLIVGLGVVIGAVIMSILVAIASVNDLPL